MEQNKIYQGDCLEVMKEIEDKSVDMILCDLPYGTTACSWDTIIPLDKLWEQYKRIIKDNGAIVLTASQPFTSILINSNIRDFKYCWIWKKTRPSLSIHCNKMPLNDYEDIVVFYKVLPNYNPQMSECKRVIEKERTINATKVFANSIRKRTFDNKGLSYPRRIIEFSNPNNNNFHPTQKPIALFEYLIKTYTNKGMLVLDNCIGSGTTAVACIKTNRNFIGIELSPEYCEIANRRINEVKKQTTLAVRE